MDVEAHDALGGAMKLSDLEQEACDCADRIRELAEPPIWLAPYKATNYNLQIVQLQVWCHNILNRIVQISNAHALECDLSQKFAASSEECKNLMIVPVLTRLALRKQMFQLRLNMKAFAQAWNLPMEL